MPHDPFLNQSQDGGGPQMPQLKAGQCLFNRRYELLRLLGAGGMGVVWLARDHIEEIDVALKFLPSVVVLQEGEMRRLREEVRAGKELRHPRLVATSGMEVENGIAAIVMEFVHGQTLLQRLEGQPRGFFEPEEITGWIKDMTDGLTYLHDEAKRIHRDLKPANVMIDANGRAKLMDFGISHRIKEGVSRHSKTGEGAASASSSTLAYASPQQISGKPSARADDLYSLGATVYELLTGTPPFFRGGMDAVRGQIKDEPPTPIMERRQELVDEGLNRDVGKTVRSDVAQAVMACLAKERERRPTDAAVLWQSFSGQAKPVANARASDSQPRRKPPASNAKPREVKTAPAAAPAVDMEAQKRAALLKQQQEAAAKQRKEAELAQVVKQAEDRWRTTTPKQQPTPPPVSPPPAKDQAPTPPPPTAAEQEASKDDKTFWGCNTLLGVLAFIAAAVDQLVRGKTDFSWEACFGAAFGTFIVLGPCLIMPVYIFVREIFATLREKTLVLEDFDANKKISVIKEVCDITGLGLAEAKSLVEARGDRILKKGLSKADAIQLKQRLQSAGALVRLQ
ncbi:MAG: ribosomal protein L7/L12 [Prosthecobacter sp.]